MPVLKNARWERFAQEIAKGRTQEAAYVTAGYKPSRQHAGRLATKGDIRARITELQDRAATKVGITLERVLDELAALGFSRVTDFMKITTDGEPAIDLSDLTDEQRAAIAEVTVEDFTDGRGEDARDVRRVKFKLHDKLSAIDKIARLMKWYEERHVLSGPDGGPVGIIEREIIRPKAKAANPDC